MLDILETSEQKRYKRALLDHFHLPVNVSPSQVDKETQAAINGPWPHCGAPKAWMAPEKLTPPPPPPLPSPF